MILLVGFPADPTCVRLRTELARQRRSFRYVDQSTYGRYGMKAHRREGEERWQVTGGECTGRRPVDVVFVRHAPPPARPGDLRKHDTMQARLGRLLSSVRCPVANPPGHRDANFSKALQVRLLEQAGFRVPRTLVTNDPAEARRFYDRCNGNMIVKGVSSFATRVRRVTPRRLRRLELLPACPALFQEHVPGRDFRVHVIGQDIRVTRILTRADDYRRSSLRRSSARGAPGELPRAFLDRCSAVTRAMGLFLSGIDLRCTAAGELVVFELNPWPNLAYYDAIAGQDIVAATSAALLAVRSESTNLFV